ncbi:glycoside hydrolase family 28 protein [Glonium stellatum]|uniref:Glycoside hydrolase family 28 protein n=1 Tax=Glonium stellatum TaxID=574774 RepID=A0A8E2JMD7_9PEZI|nr:glycoside hydrolase family 28 protein [Glonium stellatum]
MLISPLFAFISLCPILITATTVSYPRPSIYNKSYWYSLTVNGTNMYTVSYAGYDYVHLSMTKGDATKFRIASVTESSITKYNITPKKLAIQANITGSELSFSLSTEIDVPASSGAKIYNVLDYGAENNGSNVTTGVREAVNAASATAESIVYVPAGLYYIGNFVLRNSTQLYLAGGSVLRFTGNKTDYKQLFVKSDLAPGTWWIQTEFGSINVKIYGRGTIDGNGYYSQYTGKFIAHLIVPVDTTGFRFDGPLVRDGSFWAITPTQSQDVEFRNLKILNRLDVGQDDGIDVIESTNVRVLRAISIALGDSYSTKTWTYNTDISAPYPKKPQPLSDVLFENCIAWTTGVVFKDGIVYNAAVGIGIDHRYGTAKVANVTFDNIDVESLSGDNAGHGTWIAFFIESEGEGIGPVSNGKYTGLLLGYNNSAIIDAVDFSDVFMFANMTAAGTLGEMTIAKVNFTKSISIQ